MRLEASLESEYISRLRHTWLDLQAKQVVKRYKATQCLLELISDESLILRALQVESKRIEKEKCDDEHYEIFVIIAVMNRLITIEQINNLLKLFNWKK